MAVASSDPPKRLALSPGRHDDFLKSRRDRMQFFAANRPAVVLERHLHQAVAFIRQLTQIDVTRSQVETMLELYPFVRIQVAKYGVYADRVCMDELAIMVADFFLGVPWHHTSGNDASEDDAFLRLLQQQADKMGYRLIKDPFSKLG